MGNKNTSKAFDTFDLMGTRKGLRAAGRAKKSAKVAQEAIDKQKKVEELKIAEEEDAIGRKKLQSRRGGRSLLVATSPTGAATNTSLGGT